MSTNSSKEFFSKFDFSIFIFNNCILWNEDNVIISNDMKINFDMFFIFNLMNFFIFFYLNILNFLTNDDLCKIKILNI